MKIAVEAVGLAAAAADHDGGVGARGDADEDALVGAIDLLAALPAQVALELLVDDLGGEQQGDLAQLGELAFEERRIGGRGIRTALGDGDAILGRGVDDLDLIGGMEKGLGHGVGDGFAANGLDLALALGDELEIDGGDDRDAGVEQLLHILPTMLVRAAGRIAVGEAVDEADLRMAAQDGGHVDCRSVEAFESGMIRTLDQLDQRLGRSGWSEAMTTSSRRSLRRRPSSSMR